MAVEAQNKSSETAKRTKGEEKSSSSVIENETKVQLDKGGAASVDIIQAESPQMQYNKNVSRIEGRFFLFFFNYYNEYLCVAEQATQS